MSEYERFVAFQECTAQRLGRDIVQTVFKAMDFTRVDLEKIYDDFVFNAYDTAVDMENHLDYLREHIYEAKRQAGIIGGRCGIESEQYKQAMESFEDARQEFRNARADFLARIQSHKDKALAVKAQMLLL
jgi:hypothetical protein